MIPKGKLLIIGGHEDKGAVPGENLTVHKKNINKSHFEILGYLIQKIPRAHHVIEIIAAASAIPEQMEELYINSYKKEGFTHVGFIKVENRKDAASKEAVKKIKGAHAVFFTGGNQSKLVALLTETPLLAAIKTKYNADKNFIVGGTSAGAMAMPSTIISHGIIAEALFAGDLTTEPGFNLIDKVIIDTHFIKRGRFARLAHAVTLNPTCIGLGLGEDTALLISEGTKAKCIGTGMVVIIDGRKIKNSNINTAKGTQGIYIENLIVNILVEGSEYVLQP